MNAMGGVERRLKSVDISASVGGWAMRSAAERTRAIASVSATTSSASGIAPAPAPSLGKSPAAELGGYWLSLAASVVGDAGLAFGL